jgi:hypothetical protein
MYITADAEDSILAEKYTDILPKSVQKSAMAGTTDLGVNRAHGTGRGTADKVESWDVKKTGEIITDDVPGGGRWVLLNYFKKVEKEIATEVAARKSDIQNIRVKMAKNRAYNAKARATMKHELLVRMAANAKKAKDDLDSEMRKTSQHFERVHKSENRRFKETLARSRKTRAIMRKNKKEQMHNLHMAVLNQQRALSALDSATNEKIHQTQKNIAANAGQIKANAIKARKDLDHAVNKFNQKMYNVNQEAKKGRSKLAAEAKAMDKKVRAMVTTKVHAATMWAAKEFQDVRSTMSKNRHHADMMLMQASARMKAALATQKALQDKRFKKTVADIAQTRKEADDQVKAFKKSFKVQILHLSAVAHEQVGKLNGRVTQLNGVVTSDKLEQAKINTNVYAEMNRMMKIGNDRESKLAENDKALKTLMAKNKAATEKSMQKMARAFYAALQKIRTQMKKDRKYSERRLAKTTSSLYATLAKNQKAQEAVNKKLTAATKAAEDEARRNLAAAKHDFATRLGALTTTVKKNEKKVNKKIQKLTGVVAQNAINDAKGRAELRSIQTANKNELKAAIRDAVAKGEKRARQVEAMAKDMNKKTRAALSSRISTEIGSLTKKIHSDIEGLRLQSAEARKQMKAEVLASLREEEQLLKKQLGDAVKWANKKFLALDERLEKEEATSKAGNAALKSEIDSEKKIAQDAIADAVAAQARALMALKIETAKKIKKTNTRVDAYGSNIVKHAKQVQATMAANIKTLEGKLTAAKKATESKLAKADAKSMARHKSAIKSIESGLEEAKKRSDKKFGEVWVKMGEDRSNADKALAAATSRLNDSLAKHAALEDSRFRKTVKDIKSARKEAKDQVDAATKEYKMGLAGVNANLKKVETRILGEIQIVAKMVVSDTAAQARVNKKVDSEINRIEKLSDSNYSQSKRARGKIKEIMNKNKAIAKQEVKDLKAAAAKKLKALRAYQAKLRRQAAQDLTGATEKLYMKLSADKLEQETAIKKMSNSLKLKKASTAAALAKYKKDFAEAHLDLVNIVSANHKSYEKGMKDITQVTYDWKKSSAADRVLLRQEAKAMGDDLNKAIVKAIQIGEARAKEVLEVSLANIDVEKKALQIEIQEQVERMADNVFKTVQSKRNVIANNYLSLKGYCGAAQDDIIDYVQKGQGKGLSSIGEFLMSVAVASSIKTKAAFGVSAGSGSIEPAFAGDVVKEVVEISKVNGLVDEYSKLWQQTAMAYPYGLGKYLMAKLAQSMTANGVLIVGKKNGSSGQYVHVNAKTLGLSHKMEAFSDIGARLTHYQSALAKLTAKLPKHEVIKPLVVPPPEWQGD